MSRSCCSSWCESLILLREEKLRDRLQSSVPLTMFLKSSRACDECICSALWTVMISYIDLYIITVFWIVTTLRDDFSAFSQFIRSRGVLFHAVANWRFQWFQQLWLGVICDLCSDILYSMISLTWSNISIFWLQSNQFLKETLLKSFDPAVTHSPIVREIWVTACYTSSLLELFSFLATGWKHM